MPSLETLEHIMKASQLLTQALQEKSSPLLQLPYITQDMLKYFVCRKVKNNISHFIFILILQGNV